MVIMRCALNLYFASILLKNCSERQKNCLRLLELQKVAQKLPTTIGAGLLPLPLHSPPPRESRS